MKHKRIGTWVLIVCLLVVGGVLIWIDNPILSVKEYADQLKWSAMLLAACLALLFLDGLGVLGIKKLGEFELLARWRGTPAPPNAQRVPGQPADGRGRMADLDQRSHLREHYGWFWRRRVRLLLVVGQPEQIEAIVPGLAEARWLEGQGTVLLWGGALGGRWETDVTAQVRRLRPLDGVVWALTREQSDDVAAMSTGVLQLRELARTLHRQTPLYLWEVCASAWPQSGRPTQAVGCLFPAQVSAARLEASLRELPAPLRRLGMAQIQKQLTHDFLLRLSYNLGQQGIVHWREVLMPFLASFARDLPLRGLMFSLPQTVAASGMPSIWWPDESWRGVLDDKDVHGRRLGFSWVRGAYAFSLASIGLLALACLLSFVSNRSQIADAEKVLAELRQPGTPDSQLAALNELTRELARLDYQVEHGAPWHLRLGLNQSATLLASLWPEYAEAHNRLMRDFAAGVLEQELAELAALPPDSVERAEQAATGHARLKAYLMMARPEKVDPVFLVKTLATLGAQPEGVTPGLWQGISPNLWSFYARHLPRRPDWRIAPDMVLVAQARQVLLGQLGQRNGVASLYQQVLEQAGNQHADLRLLDMVGETDAMALFGTPNSVPGVFTRQAWEGHVRKAIDDIAQARREEIDWVLSDQQGEIAEELQPEALKAQLTERYFQDFGDAWLTFLNSIRWRQAQGLSNVIDQLTLMADVRQSPLIALMNTLAYQGKTDIRGEALSDSLIKSAQQLLDKDKRPVIDQQAGSPRGPLDSTFGPLLALVGKEKEAAGANGESLSLQAYLTRVTRVRLKLQQIVNAPDPQAMTQTLARSVFQGRSVDLTDTRDYGSLVAASLGAQWSGLGHNLFVQPLSQAWEGVLQPSAQSLNHQWQRSIVDNWKRAFEGRYPFSVSDIDASLPMLGRMIRADTGRIDQFIASQLGGALHKEGNRWVVDASNSLGLRFNPEFLRAINRLGELAELLYTDGGMGLTFQLQAKPVRDVVQTTLIVDGQRLEYFNQRESWQPFTWPAGTDHPGASLSWTSTRSGARLFGDYAGTWGLIRLFEQAQVTALDTSGRHLRLVIAAPDQLPLTWHIRTELGNGPLALLGLRGFTLPERIFEVGNVKTAFQAARESDETEEYFQ